MTMTRRLLAAMGSGFWLLWLLAASFGLAQTVTTTTVQGTVFLADGTPGSGTLLVSWPAFTTASNQAVAAGNQSVPIGSDGFVSINLAPNLGANPAGLYYTAVFHLSDGTVNTEYWVVPAAASATIAAVRAQLMPATQAVQTVSKAYVDQAIANLESSLLTANGGTLTGPLTLCCDPTTPLMAADKHYVDTVFSEAVPIAGGAMTGALTTPAINGVYSPAPGSGQTTLQQTVTAAGATGAMVVPPSYAGTDTFTNPSAIRVEDLRTGVAQQHERSVKEFGAVCDGATDDTLALQAALNYAYAQNTAGQGVVLTLPAGTCKTQQLVWHGESIGGQGRQVSALMGFPGQDVLASPADTTGMLTNTRLHDLTIYVDQSVDVSCTPAQGRAAAGSCGVSRPIETASVFSPGGSGLTGTAGTGAGWQIGNCAIAMPALTGAGGNGLRRAEIENVAIATVGTDPLGTYAQADSTHTCGMYLAQWPLNSEFRNIDIRGVGTGIAMPGLPVATPAGLVADSNRWQNVTVQAVHGFAATAGGNGVLDEVTLQAWNSAATGEPPTGLVLDFTGPQQGWTVRNALVQPEWVAVQPRLTVTASGGAVTGVAIGPEHGLGFEAYGPTVTLGFSGSCTAQANAAVNADGSLGAVTVTAGGVGCSSTTTANALPESAANSMPARVVNLIAGNDMTFTGGNLLKGTGGYTVWNAAASRTLATQMGGGGTLTASTTTYPALVVGLGAASTALGSGYTGSANRFDQLGLTGSLQDSGLGNSFTQASATGYGLAGLEAARMAPATISADFAMLGGGTASQAFTSLNDLFFSAEDLLSPSAQGGESVGTGSLFAKDTTAPVTGSYVKAVGGAWDTSGVWTLRGKAGSLLLGKGFPAGSGTWIVAAKADAAATQELKLTGTTGSASCTFADQTVSLTTSWQVFRIPYNTVTGIGSCDSATAGNAVTAVGLSPSVGTNVETAWLSFVPAAQQILIANQPTQANQAANKSYVDTQIASQIVSGSGVLPITGGTLTGPLYAPAIDGTTDCALSSSVSSCVAGAASALVPPTVTSISSGGSYQQYGVMQATAQCLYDPTQGGKITSVAPGQLGLGYTSAPGVTVSGGGGGGLAVTAVVSGGQVTSYTVTSAGSGFTSCPTISVAPPPAPSAPIAILDQRRGVTSYSAEVRVDDFGCAADGVTDDTQCFNDAIQFSTLGGTRAGAITLSQGKTYYIGTITGYMQTAWDDGTAPSTDTCGGVPCTNLPPETPGYLGYAVRIPSTQSNPFTIYGNGATIVSAFNGAAGSATYTLSAPFFAVFGSDRGFSSWNLYDININNAFIGAVAPGGAYWRWDRVSMNGVGIAAMLGSSQFDTFRDMNIQNASAGIIIGGWWGTRAPATSPAGGVFLNDLNLGDSTDVDGIVFYGRTFPTQSQSQIAQNALDTWFNTYFFHVGDNQTRLSDQDVAIYGPVTDAMWRGIYHVMFATYSRYMRPVLDVTVHNSVAKQMQNYPIIATAASGWVIDGLTAEDVGWCDGNGAYGAFGSTSCPNPYDSVDNQLPAPILLYGFHDMYVKDVQVGGNPLVETVAEPQQVSAAQQLIDFRAGLTNLNSSANSSQAPRTQAVSTGRLIMSNSNSSYPPGVTNSDTGEMCLKGVNEGFTDEWCLRGVEQAYPSSTAMPRYLTMENDGYAGFTGLTAVQAPGLRVRPGLISGSDTTVPVTDFAGQGFTIAGGSVSGEACATVPGIGLANAATTDGVAFVRAPSAIGQLQLSGSVTAANTLSLSVCNPSTLAQSYPAGTYYAFLLAGAPAASTPAVSGGTPVTTNPLTTTEGDLVVGDINGNPSRLAGNSTTTGAVLTQVGNGTAANEPVWQTAPSFYAGNLTGLNAANITTGSVGILNGGTGATTAVQALANLNGASLSASVSAFAGELTGKQVGGAYQVDQLSGADIGAQITSCLAGLNSAYGGVCDARNYTGTVTMAATLTLNVANTTVLLPCATISTAASIVVPAGVRNVTLKGCGLRGASMASGSQGGTVILYTGSGAAVQVGDPTYAADTMGFHMDNLVINTTGSSTGAGVTALTAYRTQELDLESLYLLGNANQVGMTLDGTANYTGGTFYDLAFNGWQTAVNGIGHQVSNPATTDWMNASTFIRLHIDCPTSSGSPISGTYGINLAAGDGNTFTGGDVEGCATALHLGPNAQNNTIVGLRNENSNSQVVADSGSQFNSWITGGTMFTGDLTDNGSRNSFLDSFHRDFNGVKGDWFASQVDATVTNHYRLGIGAGNVRGWLNEAQVDVGTTTSQYNWLWGLTDGSSGQSNWIFQDLINNTIRLQMQENNAAGNNSTAINGTGTGNVCFQCSGNAGTGGVAFSSGGATPTTVATLDSSGNAQFLGTLQVSGVTTHGGSVTVKNQADAEIDSTLWAGATTTQKESFIYKDYTGASQWYMVKDTGNNWSLNSAIDNTDHFKAYQSGETMLNSNGTAYVSVNREASSGTGGFLIFSGGASPTQVAKVDTSGNITNAGTHVSTGNITVQNGANAEADLVVQAGSSADQNGALEFNGYSGTDYWKLKKDGSNYLRLTDVVNSLDRMVLFQNGATMLNAGAGANAVAINNTSGSGTGGLVVYGGGSSSSTAELTVTGSGNVTANGFVSAKYHIGSGSMTLATGSAAGTGATVACTTSHVCDSASGTITLTTGTAPATGTLATLTFPNTHTNQANCMVAVQLTGTGQITSVGWSESTTAVTLTANSALTASTAYSVRYWCGGN